MDTLVRILKFKFEFQLKYTIDKKQRPWLYGVAARHYILEEQMPRPFLYLGEANILKIISISKSMQKKNE